MNEEDFKYVHYHLRLHEACGTIFLFVIQFHYDCEVIVFDDVGIHPITMSGHVGPNVAEEQQEITNEIYHDLVGMLHKDGIC
jgi:hypothetical protein